MSLDEMEPKFCKRHYVKRQQFSDALWSLTITAILATGFTGAAIAGSNNIPNAILLNYLAGFFDSIFIAVSAYWWTR